MIKQEALFLLLYLNPKQDYFMTSLKIYKRMNTFTTFYLYSLMIIWLSDPFTNIRQTLTEKKGQRIFKKSHEKITLGTYY